MSTIHRMKLGWRGLAKAFPSHKRKMSLIVEEQAQSLTVESNSHKKTQALFIDMGSNLGQGFRFFSKHYSPNIFDYWLIEVNPYCIEPLRANISKLYSSHAWSGNWEIINKAVSTKNGTLKLYGLVEDKRGQLSVGASVIKDHNSIYYHSNEAKALKVPSLAVSELVTNASKKYSTIVVKMDIESAEYDVLDDLINSGAVNKIDYLYVEWHSQYFSSDKQDNILARESKIKTFLSGKLTDWD